MSDFLRVTLEGSLQRSIRFPWTLEHLNNLFEITSCKQWVYTRFTYKIA